MTDYKNELRKAFAVANTAGPHACYCERSVDKGCECAIKDEYVEEAIAKLEALLSKRELEARVVELDLLEQAMNRATEQGSVVSLTPYKIMRLKDLTDRLNKLTNGEGRNE